MPTDKIETAVEEKDLQSACSCSVCRSEFTDEDGMFFDDHELCPDCLSELTSVCCRCGERIWNESNYGSDGLVLCQSCYDAHYTTCESCGAVISFDDSYHTDDDDYDYCYSCYCQRQDKRRIIHDYYYKPEPEFYPSYNPKELYLGIELEIDGGGEDTINAEAILKVGNKDDEHIYIKHDGSLNDGLEIVSHPATLEYHRRNVPWKAICDKALALGYTSHNAGTAGLHVHVSRSALGESYTEQEDTVARILYFMEAHFSEMLRFSRRTENQLNKWASRYGYKDKPKDILEHAKTCNMGRYTAINITNYNTIEFRIFRGTLKYQSFIAALQIVNEICRAAIFMSDDEFKAMSWDDFIGGIDKNKNPELMDYLKLRRLYAQEIKEAV